MQKDELLLKSCLSNFTGFFAWLTIVSIAIFQVDHRYFLHIRQFHSVDYLALFSIFVEKRISKGFFFSKKAKFFTRILYKNLREKKNIKEQLVSRFPGCWYVWRSNSFFDGNKRCSFWQIFYVILETTDATFLSNRRLMSGQKTLLCPCDCFFHKLI